VAYSAIGNGAFYFASPFVLYYLYMMLNQDIRLLSGGLSSRQSLRRHLEASTLNPRDYDAHYQLGLIYQQRRNYPEAIARFEKAIEIAPTEEADAHYQLGRIAREQGRHDEARKYFVAALAIDDKHSSSEVWRDLGATDYELGRLDQARAELEKYADRRGYDPEGLYWLGMTLKKLGRSSDAREAFERSLEAAKTSPSHRRRQAGKWGGLAQGELRGIPKGTS
jgi:tetratricopeptide (TPR) repeat protein